MIDALEELKGALERYHSAYERFTAIDDRLQTMAVLGAIAAKHLPDLLAELEARRAAMGEDITTQAGFSGRETEAMR